MRNTGIPISFTLKQVDNLFQLNWRYMLVYYEAGGQYLYFYNTPEEVIACEKKHGYDSDYAIYDKRFHVSKILLLPLAMRTTYISIPRVF